MATKQSVPKRLKPYTRDDVANHNTVKDAWVVLDHFVMDITHFFPLHPGGEKIFYDYLGKDVSKVFMDPSVHLHSAAARKLFKKFYVGYIDGEVDCEKVCCVWFGCGLFVKIGVLFVLDCLILVDWFCLWKIGV